MNSPGKRTSQRKQMVILRQVGDTPYCLSLAPSLNRKDLSSYGYFSHTFQPSCLCSAVDRQIIVLQLYRTSSWMCNGTPKWKPRRFALANHHMKQIVHFLFSPLAARMKGIALPIHNIPISSFHLAPPFPALQIKCIYILNLICSLWPGLYSH